jgi:hypothetical protein
MRNQIDPLHFRHLTAAVPVPYCCHCRPIPHLGKSAALHRIPAPKRVGGRLNPSSCTYCTTRTRIPPGLTPRDYLVPKCDKSQRCSAVLTGARHKLGITRLIALYIRNTPYVHSAIISKFVHKNIKVDPESKSHFIKARDSSRDITSAGTSGKGPFGETLPGDVDA